MAIAAARPDVLALVEVESRPTLLEFHEYIYLPVLDPAALTPFGSLMLIDGNDDRGIDVGLALRPATAFASMLSHVDDRMANGELVFSRDCPEYHGRDAVGRAARRAAEPLQEQVRRQRRRRPGQAPRPGRRRSRRSTAG